MGSSADRRVVSVPPRGFGAAADVNAWSGEGPRLEQFLLGRTQGFGLFQDRSGAVRRRFAIELDGQIKDGVMVLTEDFTFDDGEKERRVWRIACVGENGYEARADDIVGRAQGEVRAGELRWSYLFSLKVGEKRFKVRFNERFVQVGQDLLINEARISKFGFRVGQTTLVFRRRD